MDRVSVEIKGNRIRVDFDYSRADVAHIRRIPGKRFVPGGKPHWTIPLDLESCRSLRKEFGDRLDIGPNLWSWAKNAKRHEEFLGKLALADHAPLTRLPAVLPRLYQALFVGPIGLQMTPEEFQKALKAPHGSYQTADVRFQADAIAALNGIQAGMGKTPETVGAIWEAGIEDGNHLVITTKTAVDGTWEDELLHWQEDAPKEVGVFACTGTKRQRQRIVEDFVASTAPVKWLLVNPGMVKWTRSKDHFGPKILLAKPKDSKKACHCDKRKKAHWHYNPSYPQIDETVWSSITIDECHKDSIRNHKSLTSIFVHGLLLVAGGKKIALSATPMKKMGADIWGILHWLRPDIFTSFWAFAEKYFDVEVSPINKQWRKVGKLRPEMADEFFRMLTPYMLRRTKAEYLPWLPQKHYINKWVTLEDEEFKEQRRLYEEMEEEGIARLATGEISTTSVLAEGTRLRQFAIASWKMVDGKLKPTTPSCKMAALLEVLDERGILDGSRDEKVVIFSQFREVIEWVAGALTLLGVEVDVLSGKQNKQGQRKAIKNAFQYGSTKVLCVVTTAGGVSLTLDAADTAIFMDETWSPDDQEQAEDRLHRASRKHQVTIIIIRTKDTFDEYVMDTSFDKQEQHNFILDVRRRLLAKAA